MLSSRGGMGSPSPARLEALFVEHSQAVAKYARRRCPSEAVDDVVAETFLVAWRKSGAIPPDPLPWLLAIARRVISTQRRSARRRGFLIARLLQTGSASPTDEATEVDLQASVRHALEHLTSADREALTLSAWDDLTSAQAAAVLGIKPAAYRARVSRALRRLERQLAAERISFDGSNPATPDAVKQLRGEFLQ